MSKPRSEHDSAAGIESGDSAQVGNDRRVPKRYARKSRGISIMPVDCHIDPQVMEIDVFDLSAVRREAGALTARMFAVVDDVSLAVAVERLVRDGVPWQKLAPCDDVHVTRVVDSAAFHRIAERLNTNLGNVIEFSPMMREASERLIHGIENLCEGVGEIKDATDELKLR